AGEPVYHPEWLWLAEALLREAQGVDAVDGLLGSWELAIAFGLPVALPLLGPHLVRLALLEGRSEDARTVAAAVGERCEPVDRVVAAARWCTALAAGDADDLIAAARLVAAGARPLDGALAAEDAAWLLAREGRHDEARPFADEAMRIYEELSASQRSALGAARLRDAGMRLGRRGARSRPTVGWEALTATEQRVAELVGETLSNAEIARRLFISRRTVETHVAHILSKVGCDSKRELARQVGTR
ncbi:MAG: hypothetical protein QOG42_2648, partial [Solirubrobacteraceae bacterium]|nr:hypothetical protein [Solirubrobacteraceae bacterium]